MPLPDIDEANAKKPLSYDPARRRFVYFDDIVSGREPIVPVDSLSDDDFRALVIERQRAGPDYTVRAMSGQALTRDDVVRAIESDDPFGRVTLEAERSMLRDLLTRIEAELP